MALSKNCELLGFLGSLTFILCWSVFSRRKMSLQLHFFSLINGFIFILFEGQRQTNIFHLYFVCVKDLFLLERHM